MDCVSQVIILICGIFFCSASIENRLTDLESIVKIQRSGRESLTRRIEKLKKELSDLSAAEQRIKKRVKDENYRGDQYTQEKIPSGSLTDVRSTFERAAGNNVGFYAYRTTNVCSYNHETIVFDMTSIDLGGVGNLGVYNNRDGIFEPSVTGIYVFSWTVAAPKEGHRFVTELVINGIVKGILVSEPDISVSSSGTGDPPPQKRAFEGSGVHPSTAVVVARVSAGHRCFIRVRHSTGACTYIFSEKNTVLSTFSAWRLN